jgi:perosamine synthetase
LIEDAAESLGSFVDGVHTGVIGDIGILSYNGNKVMTTGGGGMILCKSEDLGQKAKHITTTAKKAHRWAYDHDQIGFNYRLPNLNAALGVAQMKKLPSFLKKKRKVAELYNEMFSGLEGVKFFKEKNNRVSNYWLNALIFEDPKMRDEFLLLSNDKGVMTRPPWGLMNEQEPYKHCYTGDISVAEYYSERLVNIPSSVIDYEG